MERTKLPRDISSILRSLILVFALISLSSLGLSGIHLANATGNSVNVITHPGFEDGSSPCSPVPSQQCPLGWDFETCEGVLNATVSTDSSQWTEGSESARIATGPITPSACFAPTLLQSATCSGLSQSSLKCSFGSSLNYGSVIAFCMGMSGTGNTFSASDTLGNTFTIQQEVTTNAHVACGYSSTNTSFNSDNVTLTFQPNSLTDFGAVYEVQGVDSVNNSGPCSGSGVGQSFACSGPITVIGHPFVFSMTGATGSMGTYSAGADFVATNITASGNSQYSTSKSITNTACPSTATNSVTFSTVCVFIGLRRGVGFSQFRTDLRGQGQGYNFTTLTNDPNEFSFWFRLQPYNGNGMAGFEVRLFGAESLAELDYVINPDPSIGNFANSSRIHALYFTGYNYGQWYHFSRNIKADWQTAGLSLSWNFTLLQFQGFATQTANIVKSETYWLDDVRVYVGTGPIPVENDYAYWSFKDANNNDASSVLNWTVTNSSGQTVAYTQGQFTLPPGPYFLQTYYRAYASNNLILVRQIRLNQTNTIQLPLYPSTLVPNGYVALNNPVTSLSVNNPYPTGGTIQLQGSTGTQYVMLVDVPSGPVLIQANGYNLNPGYEWTYDATHSVVRISFVIGSGSENITIFFQAPVKIPNLSFVDREGASIDSKIRFSILDSQGRTVNYIPGAALPQGTFYLEAYYAGFRIYRNNLTSIGVPPVTLQMTQLDPTSGSYIALNSTATATPTQFNNSQIAFSITGTGPSLIIVNVPKRPLYVEEDGVRTPNWVYNSTNQVISIEASGPGSFLVVLDQPAANNYLYLAIGATAAIAAAIGVYVWNRRRRKPVGLQAGTVR